MLYKANLSSHQRNLLRILFPRLQKKLAKHDPFDILEAIFFIVYTSSQWRMLPDCYPPSKTVYYHFRSWSECGGLEVALRALVSMKRREMGCDIHPGVAVIDSQSVRAGLPHSEAGVDGGKKVKGIKRHIAVDEHGFPMAVNVTTANVHDSKGAHRLVGRLLSVHKHVTTIKADLGYRGCNNEMPLEEMGVSIKCIKSNHGTATFIPIDGRWVVERTFSWLQTYRRLMRNYERYTVTAEKMTLFACLFFMLRYF